MKLIRTDYEKKPAFYEALEAFQQGRVYTLHPYIWYANNLGTTIVDAYAVGKLIYPERFEDIDPIVQADAIYTALVGGPVYRDMVKAYGPLGAKPAFLD